MLDNSGNLDSGVTSKYLFNKKWAEDFGEIVDYISFVSETWFQKSKDG